MLQISTRNFEQNFQKYRSHTTFLDSPDLPLMNYETVAHITSPIYSLKRTAITNKKDVKDGKDEDNSHRNGSRQTVRLSPIKETVPRYSDSRIPLVSPNSILSVTELEKKMRAELTLPKKDFLITEFHRHPNASNSGLLQICCDKKELIYHKIDNRDRELDRILRDPANSICSDILDNVPELILPGPSRYEVKPTMVGMNSTKYELDVLGLFILMIDMIYACDAVTYTCHKVKRPMEFSQQVVKIINVVKAAFPDKFAELQKMVMYSTLVRVLVKVPFEWTKLMVQVLEELIIHPQGKYVKMETIKFNLLVATVQKRAKDIFKQPDFEKVNMQKLSAKYRCSLLPKIDNENSMELQMFMKRTAVMSAKYHQIKNIRYQILDQRFFNALKSVILSYNNIKC